MRRPRARQPAPVPGARAPGGATAAGVAAVTVAAVAVVAVAAVGCAGAPWFMGEPLDGELMIPPTTRAGTVAQHRRAADRARTAGHKLVELAELSMLEARQALRSDERARLAALLDERSHDWEALGRPIPLWTDLERVAVLAPERKAALAPRIEEAALAAGERWRALGDTANAERAYRRAAAFGYGGRRVMPRTERDKGGGGGGVPSSAGGVASAAGVASAGGGAASPGVAALAVPPPVSPVTAVEPAADDWLLGGATLARGLLPLVELFPHLVTPGARSRAWADWLLSEDPTAPDSLELAARIDAAAGRLGGAERKLVDLVYYSTDRAAGHARAAAVWQWAGQQRRACAAWERAARLGPPDDLR